MTTVQFDVLDELYFLQSYDYLTRILKLNDKIIKDTLEELLKKGWIKCYSSPAEELMTESLEFEKNYWNYHYLATKAGLIAHNSNF